MGYFTKTEFYKRCPVVFMCCITHIKPKLSTDYSSHFDMSRKNKVAQLFYRSAAKSQIFRFVKYVKHRYILTMSYTILNRILANCARAKLRDLKFELYLVMFK